jgi:hypothetical protein
MYRREEQRILKCAILVAMADEIPFSEIKSAIHPELESLYRRYGFEVFYVYGEKRPPLERKIRRRVEEIRWGRFHIILRLYDFLFLNLYRFFHPKISLEKGNIFVDVPEDIRHLSVKILSALELLIHQDYEVIIRTTVSSILNPKLLMDFCTQVGQEDAIYYGGRQIKQSDGFEFVSGSFTIWNNSAVNFLLDSRKNLDFSLVDDVCFGRIFRSAGIPVKSVPSFIVRDLSEIPATSELEKTLHFRCRTGVDVRDDVPVMRHLLGLIVKLM